MPPNTTRTTNSGQLPRYNTNAALLYLTESTLNVWCLPETAKTISVLKVAPPSRHLPAYYVCLFT